MTKHFVILFRDAEDAVSSRDGYDYDGYRLRVEFPRGGGRGGRGDGRGGGGDRGGGRGGDRGRGGGAPARRSQYRVVISGTKCIKLVIYKTNDRKERWIELNWI